MTFFAKNDLSPDLARSNVDLGLKTIRAIARSRQDTSTVFFPRSSTTIRGRSPGWTYQLAKVAKYGKRARVNNIKRCVLPYRELPFLGTIKYLGLKFTLD